MSYSLDDFFNKGSKKKTDETKLLFDFVERAILNLAEVVDQLDSKVTSFEETIKELQGKVSKIGSGSGSGSGSDSDSGVSAPPATAPPAAAPPGVPGLPAAPAPPSSAAPAPPPTPGGLPPLPGLPGTPSSSPSPAPAAKSPPPSQPASPPPSQPASPPPSNPMADQASLRNELAEAFKKIRGRLDEDE